VGGWAAKIKICNVLILEGDINQQLFTADVDHIAKSPISLPGKVEINPAFAYAKITNLKVVEPLRKLRVKNI